ncbi:S-adenosyl-L-methionine-dependent methyltransferase [Mycena rosella]|uniref:S-adenosyl-L-methionine-dependent methyltransferase n=1 Tax=Mycena rosella TaxID=1033263 RepID=A0AAD7CLM6_MYCRO|nr:S-adenosyl-L-methionine-dependent methyltransferase [Mycena rosella]
MGRNNKRGGRRGNKPRDDTYHRSDLVDKASMNNERFATYYQTQNIVPADQWEPFLDALRTPLPTTFRVAGSRQTAQSLNETLRDTHVPALSNVVFEEQPIPPPVQIPWYPDGLAWQFNVPKKVLRKSPEFKGFHSFLVFETEVGNISRQEAVSMLPPLFMEVEPHHKVMDMCAAPGSKTAQLLEALHAQDTLTSTSIPSGLLLANDSDHKRTHLLIHQSARLPSPALMVTNLDASIYPGLKIPSASNPQRLETLLFDRILCDVPCSGDGTMRKNLGIWKSWQPMDGNGLHGLQLRILQRAMKMLAPHGRIVYSTCSLNPVENEAVVACALKSNPDFHLVDVSAKLPELQRCPGLTVWRPTDRSLKTTYDTYETFLETCEEGDVIKGKMTRGHWPPEGVELLDLPRCIRVYPHLQDTGGFFVAVLERTVAPLRDKKRGAEEPADDLESKKPRLDDAVEDEIVEAGAPVDDPLLKAEIPAEDAASATAEVEIVPEDAGSATVKAKTSTNPAPRRVKKGEGGGSFKEHPYTFLPSDDATLASCIARLHLTPDFPSANVLVRNPEGDAARSLYITNALVKAVVQNNDYNRIRLTFAGTKVFAKQEAGRGVDAQFRVLGEALPLVLPYTDPATIVDADLVVLRTLVEGHYPLCAVFPEPFRGLMTDAGSGSHIVRFPQSELNGASLSHDVILPIWKSNVSLTLMIDKKAKSALSMRVFGKDITSPVKEKPLVVSADDVELDEDAGEEDGVAAGEEDDAVMADV